MSLGAGLVRVFPQHPDVGLGADDADVATPLRQAAHQLLLPLRQIVGSSTHMPA